MDLVNNPTCMSLMSSLANDFLEKWKKKENDFKLQSYEKFLRLNSSSLSEGDEEGIKRVIDLMRCSEDKEQEILRTFCEEIDLDLALRVQNFYLDEADDKYDGTGRQTSYFYMFVHGTFMKGAIEYFDRFSDHLTYPPFRKYILPYYEGKFLHSES
ncbi:hypothetical protein HELRODRAFT_164576 [Helobdella robusta]|uniref:Uncharacterized protein n=1 Tax=Helobdella robusta TaxID=6412 RepID=T1EVL3_HELRO|nr:hypothetical protein HELRODRAFT_164576 [Helobdella robusta]ESN94692.1 hypothetical protein HELRODRAFT_164576 [Helobdella robusta]